MEKAEADKSDFEKLLDKTQGVCTMALLRIANLVSCGLLIMTSIIRFGYLSGNFVTGFFF